MTTIAATDGLRLEARWDDPEDGHIVVVLCHPHPLDGGTMQAPLMRKVAEALVAAGAHVLRFNFRGVGMSEGSWGGGDGEVADVAGAVEAAQLAFPELPVGLTGWSFGATTSLRWQVESGSTLPWVGIAPGIRPYRGASLPEVQQLSAAPRLVIVGDRDQFASVDEMRSFADRFAAEVEVLPGSDHFFHFREEAVGRLVASHLTTSV